MCALSCFFVSIFLSELGRGRGQESPRATTSSLCHRRQFKRRGAEAAADCLKNTDPLEVNATSQEIPPIHTSASVLWRRAFREMRASRWHCSYRVQCLCLSHDRSLRRFTG